MKKFNFSSFVYLALFALGCSEAPSSNQSGDEPFDSYKVYRDSQVFRTEANELIGSGRLQFSKPLLNANSAEHFVLEWLPDSTDSWFVELSSHFSGYPYQGGVLVRLFLQQNVVMMTASSPGYPFREAVPLFSHQPNQKVRIRIELHDGISAGVRLVVWHDLLTFDDKNYEQRSRIYLGNHSFDSFEQGWSFRSHGRSLFWGLDFEGVRLTRAHRQKALLNDF